jgi:hypothetical protein
MGRTKGKQLRGPAMRRLELRNGVADRETPLSLENPLKRHASL